MRFALALAFSAACVLSAEAGPSKEIRDSWVYCSNGLTCELGLKQKIEGQKIYGMAFSRKAGPDTPIRIILRTAEPIPTGSDILFLADDAEAALIKVEDFDLVADFNEYTAKDVHRGRALLSLLRDSSSLTIKVGGSEAFTSSFSLAGTAGAMLFLDEAQGRIGTVDAIEKMGEKPSPEISVQDITDIADLPAAIRPDFESPDANCGFSDMNRFKTGQGFVAKLDENAELYALPCAEGGAYNQPYTFYTKQGDFIEPMHLAIMTEDGPSTTSSAYNILWDQNKKTLSAFYKGRGIGDCGSLDTWTMRSIDGDTSFVLKESRVKDDCDGADTPAEEWPLVWPLK